MTRHIVLLIRQQTSCTDFGSFGLLMSYDKSCHTIIRYRCDSLENLCCSSIQVLILIIMQMYVVGAHVISKYTGSYANFATERIFKPLGMILTTFSRDEAAKSGELTQTWTAHGQRIPYWNTGEKELIAGPGGVISSAVDLVSRMSSHDLIPYSTFIVSSPNGSRCFCLSPPKRPQTHRTT